MFYQDFNEQFEGYTQHLDCLLEYHDRCFIRISMNNLKDIHNNLWICQTWCKLFYQDFNEQFEGYTQPCFCACAAWEGCFIRISMNNLKDIHNSGCTSPSLFPLFYQDFNEQFEGYTQPITGGTYDGWRCFIRISMNNLKDIHNTSQ